MLDSKHQTNASRALDHLKVSGIPPTATPVERKELAYLECIAEAVLGLHDLMKVLALGPRR